MYKMPAEWEEQKAVWLTWPPDGDDWPGKFSAIPFVYAEVIRHISKTQKVRLIVKNQKQETEAKALLKQAGTNLRKVEWFVMPADRIWLRDSGPTFVYDAKGKKTLLDWTFNAWAKYDNHKRDNKIPSGINRYFKLLPKVLPTHHKRPVVMEGGAFDVNGKGSILVTEECLLSKTQERNPGFTRTDYEQVFATYLGAPNTIWLEAGIAGDDTHGHVDDISRFVSADTIVTAVEANSKDANYTPLNNNLKRLKKAKDQDSKPFTIITLPMPKPLYFDGDRLPASYANFLITNDVVLVPTFNDANDRVALTILQDLFPKREVIGIHAVDFVLGLGTIHCASQQEPK